MTRLLSMYLQQTGSSGVGKTLLLNGSSIAEQNLLFRAFPPQLAAAAGNKFINYKIFLTLNC